jgi:gamma-glutamylcysteine synthetase
MKSGERTVSEALENLLFERFIEPTRQVTQSYAGVEIELPIVNLRREPVDFEVVHALSAAFSAAFDFEASDWDAEGATTKLVKASTAPDEPGSAPDAAAPDEPGSTAPDAAAPSSTAPGSTAPDAAAASSGDVVTYDCSYNNLEISFARTDDLLALRRRFKEYYRFIRAELLRSEHSLTGMGINPHRAYNRPEPISNARYRMLYHFLRRCDAADSRFHPWPEFGMFCSASQVQIDIPYHRLLQTLDVFERLEPFKAVLFANSVLDAPAHNPGPTLLCARDMLWERSMQGYNPLNVGISERTPQSIEDLLVFLGRLSIFCARRDGRFLDFVPIPFAEYLEREQVIGTFFDEKSGAFREMPFVPEAADIAYLRSYRHCDLTFRGTVEFRSCCAQPLGDTLSVAAFHLGLVENIDALGALLDADRSLYGHGFGAPELRRLMVLRLWPDFVDRAALREQLLAILELANAGLAARGRGEEVLLEPLYIRAWNLSNPARELLAKREQGVPLATLIHLYAEL